jgi:hypothetical protein
MVPRGRVLSGNRPRQRVRPKAGPMMSSGGNGIRCPSEIATTQNARAVSMSNKSETALAWGRCGRPGRRRCAALEFDHRAARQGDLVVACNGLPSRCGPSRRIRVSMAAASFGSECASRPSFSWKRPRLNRHNLMLLCLISVDPRIERRRGRFHGGRVRVPGNVDAGGPACAPDHGRLAPPL